MIRGESCCVSNFVLLCCEIELWHQIIMLMCLPHIDRITLHLNELLKRAYSVAYLRKRSSIDLSATRKPEHFR